MKYLAIFVALIAVASATKVVSKQKNLVPAELLARATNKGALCSLLQHIENYFKPEVEDWFDTKCVPQLAGEINACHGNEAESAQQIADMMCEGLSMLLEELVDQVSALGQVLGPYFAPGGPFETGCEKDLYQSLLDQITQQCQEIGNLDPVAVCNAEFYAFWNGLTASLNNLLCG